MGIVEQIAEVKTEMARTQKNKATEHHLGRLKAKLARLESQLISEVTKKSGGKGSGFDVVKQGQAKLHSLGSHLWGKAPFSRGIPTRSLHQQPMNSPLLPVFQARWR